MNKTALSLALVMVLSQIGVSSAAFMDITRPGDAIQRVDGFNQKDGDFGDPPGAEGVENAINDIGQKYLNFLDISSGFSVTPSANPDGQPVVGIRIYTANDAEARDPASFQLAGSNDGLDGPWMFISSNNLALPEGRNPGGDGLAIPPAGNMDAFHQTFLFENDMTFDHYQVIFPTLKDAVGANSMQVAEVELLIDVIPEPASNCLLALGAFAAMTSIRRRRR